MPTKKLQLQATISIKDIIAKAIPSLTPAHRHMADYVLAHSFRAATMTIDELAVATNVSVATANRFARVLGFGGYPAFRAELVRGYESALSPVEKLRNELTHKSTCAEIMAASLQDNRSNIDKTLAALPTDTCDLIVNSIVNARCILVSGFGNSGYLAGLLANGLEPYCNNVKSLADIGGASFCARVLFKLQSQDVVIVISFPRYVKDNLIIATKARERGARIITLTDSPTSPLAALGDINLYIPSASRFNATSDSTVHAMIEALCVAVAHRTKNSVKSVAAMTELVLPWLHQEEKNK